jgi:hypothetical protein
MWVGCAAIGEATLLGRGAPAKKQTIVTDLLVIRILLEFLIVLAEAHLSPH